MKAANVTLSLLFSLLLLITRSSNAADITQILNQYPEFSSFNSYLTQTNLAADINSRQTITILVVDNANMSPITAKPLDQIKNILSVHVILDYYDVPKLQQLSGNSALVTTLFQSTGFARGQQGFLNVTRIGPGSVVFGSAMPGSPLSANLVKSVVSQPYTISVIQVSSAIIPQGIDGAKTSAPMATPIATQPPPPPSTGAATTTPPTSSAATPPPPPPSTGATPPVSSTATPPPPSAGAATTTPPPLTSVVPPAIAQFITPAKAPSQASSATVPSTAPPTSSNAPLPSTATPTSSMASSPTTAAGPSMANTPSVSVSASPDSAPMASAPGPATAAVGEPTAEPTETTPAATKPKEKGASTALDIGLAVLSAVALSTLYLASPI